MQIPFFQVDAFTDHLFGGNPAGVCPLNKWIPDREMQQIAAENNLSETAFFVAENNGFRIRWFTPKVEVNLCGHATLASGHVIFNHLNYSRNLINFESRSGRLLVRKDENYIILNFPTARFKHVEPPEIINRALGKKSSEVYFSSDYLVVFDSEKDITDLNPDFHLLSQLKTRGVIVTAKGKDVDFVSRFFAPAVGINEDPVTGSAHTILTPYWAKKLNKSKLTAHQLSERRGKLICKYLGDRVDISGNAVTYLIGTMNIDI
jgi:PhzF family phenazine biosynthesis protein